MDEIYNDGIFGKTLARAQVIEFQKCGLPHAHMLVILDSDDVPRTEEDYDSIVCAEIPDKETQLVLYENVTKHMIHGPCGAIHHA